MLQNILYFHQSNDGETISVVTQLAENKNLAEYDSQPVVFKGHNQGIVNK